MNFGRTPLLGNDTHPRPEHMASLNKEQREALDIVELIARSVQLEIETQAGDMHFINNFTVLHRREGFCDGAGPREKRHLVRMRLRSSKLGWSIPEELKKDWEYAFEGDHDRKAIVLGNARRRRGFHAGAELNIPQLSLERSSVN